MAFQLPELPFAKDALAPHMSAETLEFHWGKHHKAYVNKTNELIEGKPDLSGASLIDVVRKAGQGGDRKLFNNSAQLWNHSFFWNSMRAGGGGQPVGDVGDAIKRDFGGLDGFKDEFKKAAAGRFGSGWAWLIVENGKLRVVDTANADTPIRTGHVPLVTLDVWEHAYYIDYRNDRPRFIDTFLASLVNWDFANDNLKKA